MRQLLCQVEAILNIAISAGSGLEGVLLVARLGSVRMTESGRVVAGRIKRGIRGCRRVPDRKTFDRNASARLERIATLPSKCASNRNWAYWLEEERIRAT